VTPTSVTLDGQGSGQTVVVGFDKADASKLGDVTREALEKQLAILLDGKVLSAPVVKAPLTTGKVAFAFGTATEAENGRDRAGRVADVLTPTAWRSKCVLARRALAPSGQGDTSGNPIPVRHHPDTPEHTSPQPLRSRLASITCISRMRGLTLIGRSGKHRCADRRRYDAH